MKKMMVAMMLVLSLGLLVGCGNNADQPEATSPSMAESSASAESSATESATAESSAAESTGADNIAKDGLSAFVEEDGLWVYTDTQNQVFPETGMKIVIKKGDDGYVKFIKTTLDGTETVDYYKFDYATNQLEKYYYVSPMGVGFYYYYDLEKRELVKVENDDHEDTTEKTKSSGRWDGAVEKVNGEVIALEEYFMNVYGKLIREAVNE